MIEQDRDRYVTFVNALKDGLAYPDALREVYGTTADGFRDGFLRHMKIKVRE